MSPSIENKCYIANSVQCLAFCQICIGPYQISHLAIVITISAVTFA